MLSAMPLQNRVNPFGELVATTARGTMMGNRGGKFHRDDRTLGKRRWTSRHWICCDIHYKNKQHDAMGRYYTSVFFLDEVTALAAGHRPCFFCRRKEAQHFLSLAEPPLMADAADRILHEQRFASRTTAVAHECAIADLPDGAMIAIDGAPMRCAASACCAGRSRATAMRGRGARCSARRSSHRRCS